MELGLGLTRLLPLLIYFMAIGVIVMTIFYRIEVGIFFFVPFIPQQSLMDAIVQYPLGNNFVDFLLLAMVVRWYLDSRKEDDSDATNKKPFLVKTPFNKWIMWLAIYTYFGLWFGSMFLGIPAPLSISNPRFMTWKNFMILPMIFLIIVNNVKSKQHIQILVVLMALSMLFMDRSVVSMIAGRDTSHFDKELRVAGTFSYLGPNALAVFYAQFTGLMTCLALMDRAKWRRLLFLSTSALNYFCLAFLFSRSGYLAALFTWAFIGLYRDRRVLGAVIILLIFWKSLLPTAVVERIEMTKTEEGLDSSVAERLDLWQQAIHVFSESPILGVGFDASPYLGYKDGVVHKDRRSLHNGYLEVVSENGIIGLAIFLSFYFLGIKYGVRLYKRSKDPFMKGLGLGTAAAALGALGGNLAGSYWQYLNVSGFYWVTIGLAMRGLLMADEEEQQAQPETPPEKAAPETTLQPEPAPV
ncbi:MAG: O-antigen ligase family protein [bacterium]